MRECRYFRHVDYHTYLDNREVTMSLEGAPSPSAEVATIENSGKRAIAAVVQAGRERAGHDEVDGTRQRNLPPVE
jgi:hypothetical protein